MSGEPRRVLRHAPKPHVPFVPEAHSARLRSTPTHFLNSPSASQSPSHNGYGSLYNGNGADYQQEPEPIIARPINENNLFDVFQQQQQTTTYNRQNKGLIPFNYTGIPGVGFQSVDLLTRLRFALLSGISSEVRWALTQLVSMSKNVPQMINLKANPFFEEQLVSHYTKCPFIDDRLKDRASYPYLLQNANGEAGLDLIENSLDAALTLRNLSQDTDSAQALSLDQRIRDTAIKVLKSDILTNELPTGDSYDSITSLLQFTVDIVESISSYIAPALKDDELFVNLIDFLSRTTDRSIIISILRSVSRLLVRSTLSSKQQYAAENISQPMLDLICSFLLIDTDPELILTTLDFLYQYILPGGVRVTNLLKSVARQNLLINVLPRLLTHGLNVTIAGTLGQEEPLRLIRRVKTPPPTVAKVLSDELYAEINKLDEPQRATAWMRCCFKAISDSDVTQISLWKSYESQFQKEHITQGGKKLLPAVDFIKNVSNAFPNSAAMVISNPETSQRKFIIKGIEPRHVPVSIQTGNLEANNPTLYTTDEDRDVVANKGLPSQQRPVNFFAQPEQKPGAVTEIGNSTCLLLTGLSVHDKGKMLLKPAEKELLIRVDAVPALYDNLADCLLAIASV